MAHATNMTLAFPTIPETPVLDTIVAIAFTLIFVTGVPGNLLTIYVIARKGQVQTTTNVYILSLSCADLVFVLCSPLYAVEFLVIGNKFGEVGCRLRDTLDICTMLASIFTLSVMSIDRFFAVVFPVKSLGYRSDMCAKSIIIVIWAVSLTVALPLFIFTHESEVAFGDFVIRFCQNKMSFKAQTAYTTTVFILAFPIPFVLITFCYLSITSTLLHTDNNNPLPQSTDSKKSKRRVARMVLIIVICFFLCWLPFWIFIMLSYYSVPIEQNTGKVIAVLFISLTYVNSCLNPVLYTFLSENFRKNVKKAFKCCSRKVSPVSVIQANAGNTSTSHARARQPMVTEMGAF
ncbi:somatostatin receptor type 2-like [Saccoglossus kowalevskii]